VPGSTPCKYIVAFLATFIFRSFPATDFSGFSDTSTGRAIHAVAYTIDTYFSRSSATVRLGVFGLNFYFGVVLCSIMIVYYFILARSCAYSALPHQRVTLVYILGDLVLGPKSNQAVLRQWTGASHWAFF
jgi:hypothetical protein